MPRGCGRVLVVDDCQVIRRLIRVILEIEGFEVVTAADGLAGLEAAAWFRPEVITLDLSMPRLDGRRTVARLRRDPRMAGVPLVLVSANQVGAVPDGVDAVLPKPFEPAELARVVRRLWDEGRAGGVQQAKSLAG